MNTVTQDMVRVKGCSAVNWSSLGMSGSVQGTGYLKPYAAISHPFHHPRGDIFILILSVRLELFPAKPSEELERS